MLTTIFAKFGFFSRAFRRYTLVLVVLLLLLLAGLAIGGRPGPQRALAQDPTATPTMLPPLPQVAYTPLPPDIISPVVVQRFPQPGQELAPGGSLELVFDRDMDQAAAVGAFTLQPAIDQPQPVAGSITWPDARTLRFTPAQPLDRAAAYDAILTQAATAADGAPLAEPFIFRFSTAGYLEVAQVIPANDTTQVEANASITVIFNRPVVPLTSLEQAGDLPQPVEFEPAIKGSGEWVNTSIYVFTPSEAMPGGVTFTGRVKSGLTDAAGQALLPEDFTWSFTTQPPAVVFTSPSDGATLVPVDTALTVTFNQPVDPGTAAASFELQAGRSGPVPGDVLVQANVLTFTPTQRLEFDVTYQATVNAGVTSPAGGRGMDSPYTYSFTTVPLPRIVSTRPSDGEKDVYPYTDFSITFNAPINPNTVLEHVSMTPALPVTPTRVYTSYSPWDNTFYIGFGAKPSTDYEVRIRPGIEDPYGNTTQENLVVRFRTAPLEPSYQLRIPDFIGTYDAGLPVKMFIRFVNVNQLNLRLYQLDPQELARRPYWNWDEFRPAGSGLVRQWQERLEAPANQEKFQAINLVENGGMLPPGLYYLETDSPQVPDQGYSYYGRRHLLVVSETNLTLKTSPREALVWATDLATGRPVSGLNVVFYNEERQQVGTAQTGSDGAARLELPRQPYRSQLLALALPGSDGQGFSAVSENWARGINPYDFGLDMAYELADFNVFLYTDRPIYRPDQTVYFKGVIRAEDDVTYRLPDVGQVHLTIRDAAYETVLDEMVDVSPAGTLNGRLDLPAGAALGSYVIGVEFDNRYFEHYFQVAAYRAPEFEIGVEPAQAELLRGQDILATITASYFFGGPLANAPVNWNVLAESYRFEPGQFGNYRFDDSDDPYVCFDCWWRSADSFPQPLLSGAGVTDAAGQVRLTLDGQELVGLLASGSQRLIIEATTTGPDNQPISGRASLVVHKGDYYIGLSPQQYVADAGEETIVDLVAVDWQANRLAGKDLNVQVIRYEWVNTFVTTDGGGYWDYQTKQELVAELAVTTDERGEATARFIPPKGGSYRVLAQDAASLSVPPETDDGLNLPRSDIRSSIFIWVTGEENVSWRRENNARITLISDKAAYEPGETAEILIPSPFQGQHQALVTIERGRIIQHEVIEMSGASHVYRLPITEQHAPNIYVSVVLVQGRLGERVGDAPRLADYKVGILPVDVKPAAQLLDIDLVPGVDQAEPGQEVTYTLTAADAQGRPVAAEFSLDLVDKAVLSLLPRQPEAIVKAYYDRRGLAVATASGLSVSVNHLLLELAEDLGLDQDEFAYSGRDASEKAVEAPMAAAPMATASPGMEMPMAEEAEADMAAGAPSPAPLPPGVTIREDFSDTAYWNPVVVTGENGQAEVTLELPDNLTTWVMRGVGLTADTQVGEKTVELVATRPLLIRPVAPRFFVVDDRAELAANVSNNTDIDLAVDVTLSAAGVIIDAGTPPVQTVTIPARSEAKVTWNVTVQDVPDTELIFAAASSDGAYTDAARPRLTTGPDGTLLVLRYTAPDIVGTAGQLVGGGSRTEVIALPPNLDDRQGELTVQLDPSLAAGMRDGLSYLEHYPYECTEQTVSRFLPNVLTYNALQKLGLENEELAGKLPGLVEEGLAKLYAQQKADGGWGWWPSNESNVHVTAYVVFALTKAQQAGVDVSATVLASGQNFLLDHLQLTSRLANTYDANRHAFVLYALAEGGRAPQPALAALFEAREKMSHYARAYLALALHLSDSQAYGGEINTLLSDLNSAAILSATGAHWEEAGYDWWAMNTDTRSTAIILDALARLDPQNALIPNVVRWLMVARQAGIWETTQETAWALIALTDWMVETGELEANYDYSTYLNGQELAAGQATKENVQDSVKLRVAVADMVTETGNLLTVTRSDGNGRLYYSAHLKVYLPVEEIEPAERGIIVSRRYTLESCLAEQAQDPTRRCAEVREARLGDVIRVDLTIIAPNDLYYVVVEDPLPAGAEAIDTGLATTSLLAMDPTLHRTSRIVEDGEDYFGYRSYWWWWRWYSRSELRDDRVVLFADYLPKGSYEYSYTMRATLPGDYHVIPTVASEFYFPEVFGRSDGRLLSIGR